MGLIPQERKICAHPKDTERLLLEILKIILDFPEKGRNQCDQGRQPQIARVYFCRSLHTLILQENPGVHSPIAEGVQSRVIVTEPAERRGGEDGGAARAVSLLQVGGDEYELVPEL